LALQCEEFCFIVGTFQAVELFSKLFSQMRLVMLNSEQAPAKQHKNVYEELVIIVLT
jgi:hypothetical protein